MDEYLDLRQQKTRMKLVVSTLDILKCLSHTDIFKITNLCKKADITYATFYNHFHNKNELFQYVIKTQLEYKFPIPLKLKTHNLKQLCKYLLDFLILFFKQNKQLVLNGFQIIKKNGIEHTYFDMLYLTIKNHFYNELSEIYKNVNRNVLSYWSDILVSALYWSTIAQTIQNNMIDKTILLNNLMVMIKLF